MQIYFYITAFLNTGSSRQIFVFKYFRELTYAISFLPINICTYMKTYFLQYRKIGGKIMSVKQQNLRRIGEF
jgi:hypothetical protein